MVSSYNKTRNFGFLLLIISGVMTLLFIDSIGIVSVWIAIMIFSTATTIKRLEFWENQEDILIQIFNDANYLLEKKGHIKFFRGAVKEGGYPHHDMREFNLNFYLPNLTHKVNSQDTLTLKNKLKDINDTIGMLNGYRRDKEYWKDMMYHGVPVDRKPYEYLIGVLQGAEKKLEKIRDIIKKDFQIKI